MSTVLVVSCCTTQVLAQSDPSNFQTVISAPPTTIGDNQFIGSNTQLNVAAGGLVGERFVAGSDFNPTSTNIEVNISGGQIGDDFQLNSGSTTNISGGTFQGRIFAGRNSVVNVTDISFAPNDSPFPFTAFIAQSLSTVNISGGSFSLLSDGGSTINISGGSFQDFSGPRAGGSLSISGGTFEPNPFIAFESSEFTASSFSNAVISGGVFNRNFEARPNSNVTVSGGQFNFGFSASGNGVSLVGGEFMVNDQPVADLSSVTLGTNDVLTGTFEDGNMLLVSPLRGDSLEGIQLLNGTIPEANLTPISVNAPDSAPQSLRPGQSLTLQGLGSLPEGFFASGATIEATGGSIGSDFVAAGSSVTLSDTTIGDNASSYAGTTIDFAGGTLGNSFNAFNGSTVNISGGDVGTDFTAMAGSVVNVSDGVFGREFTVREGAVANISGGTFQDGVTTRAPFRVFEGSEVNISGGNISRLANLGFEAGTGGEINVTGGEIGSLFTEPSTTFTLSGGRVGFESTERNRSTITRGSISGGNIGRWVRIPRFGNIEISGGLFEGNFEVEEFANATISGGSLGRHFSASEGSRVTIEGGEYRLNGTSLSGTSLVTLAQNDVLSGTYADGTPFIFAYAGGDRLNEVTLNEVANLPASISDIDVNSVAPETFVGVRSGQTLSLFANGVIGDGFNAAGTVDIQGGSIGNLLFASGSTINLSSGSIGDDFQAYAGSELNIDGGSVGERLRAVDTTLNISGGQIGSAVGDENLLLLNGSIANVSGGELRRGVSIEEGATINLSGGTVGRDFDVFANSEVNLIASVFYVDGTRLTDLNIGEPVLFENRDVRLTGAYRDGTEFDFELNSSEGFGFSDSINDYFSPDATLNIETIFSIGDFNFDQRVDANDIDFFDGNLGAEATGSLTPLDLDQDGFITLDDHELLITSLAQTSNARSGTLLADANLDGRVDVLGDAFPLIRNLGRNGDASFAQGDFNADGVVNVLGDGFILIENLNQSNTFRSATIFTSAVPEPTTLPICFGSATVFLFRRKRKNT